MNDGQVHERADSDPARLLADLASAAEGGVRRRRGIPALGRVLRLPFGPPLGVGSVGYLMDRIYTRVAWMHRVDLARSPEQTLVLTAEHDDRLVADIVDEWAASTVGPTTVRLTGAAGRPHRRRPRLSGGGVLVG